MNEIMRFFSESIFILAFFANLTFDMFKPYIKKRVGQKVVLRLIFILYTGALCLGVNLISKESVFDVISALNVICVSFGIYEIGYKNVIGYLKRKLGIAQ